MKALALILLLPLTSCQATKPAGGVCLKSGVSIIKAGRAPNECAKQQSIPVRAISWPITHVIQGATLIIGTPFCAAGLILTPDL